MSANPPPALSALSADVRRAYAASCASRSGCVAVRDSGGRTASSGPRSKRRRTTV